MNKGVIICLIVCLTVVLLPLSIASIVLGAVHPGSCDYDDAMGINVSKYLLGLGIASLVFSVATVLLFIYILLFKDGELDSETGIVFGVYILLVVIQALFGMAFFIVGGVILFRGNIDCIRNGSSHVIFALVLWCLSAFQILQGCTGNKNKD
jgi:hypothetical protein